MKFCKIFMFCLCWMGCFAGDEQNENISLDSVKIKVYNNEKQEFLSNYKVIPTCTMDYPYHMFDNAKISFYADGDSIILSKKELFSKHNSKECNPFKPLILIMKEKELYLFFEINENTKDTIYLGNW